MPLHKNDPLLFAGTLAIALGWWYGLQRPWKLEWHERHPVVSVTRIIDGEELTTSERVLMYYARGQFYEPDEFRWMLAKFYVPRAVELALLIAGTLVIVIIVDNRWPQLLPLFLKLLLPIALITLLVLLFWPIPQAARE